MSYTLIDSNNGRAIRCNRCNRISYNPRDVQMKYCSNCRRYHADAVPRTAHDDRYWLNRSNAARDEGYASQQETQRLFDSYRSNDDARPASSECHKPADTSIDYGYSSSSWDSSSSSSDSSSSSSSDSGSCSSD